MKKLIFCDIDGCLNFGKNTAFDLPRLSRIKEQITALETLDIGLRLCTGRPQPYAEAIAQILGTTRPLICEGGAMIYAPGGDIYRPLAQPEALRAIVALRTAIEASDLLNDRLFLEIGNAFSLCITGPSLSEQDHDGIRAQMDRFKTMYADYPVSWTHSTTSVDITPQGVSKGSALRRMAAEEGVDLRNTYGIGDSNGDVSMFKAVAKGFCPSNASTELKALAGYISKQDHAAGTLDILLEIQRTARSA